MKRSTLLVGMGMLAAFSCTKESDEMATVNTLKTGVSPEAPFEVYEPQAEAYVELEEGLMQYLSREATAENCEVTKGIWLWETGINYWFPSTELAEDNSFVSGYEDEVIDERSIQLSLENGEFETQSLRAEFVTTYEDVDSRVGEGLEHAFTDVQFVELVGDVITLKVKSVFYLNPSYSSYSGTPTVPSATMDKMAGYKGTCSYAPVQKGSWEDAARNVRSALPKPNTVVRGRYYSNVYEYSTYQASIGKRYIDGSYLPGNANSLYSSHQAPLSASTCLLISEQNSYAQAMANQIDRILVKRTYWDGVARFVIHPNTASPGSTCSWGFYLDLATHYFYPVSRVQLAPSLVL